MKKILTLLVMFLATASILMAQMPRKLSYQMIVRDQDNNLVYNQNLGVEVYVFAPVKDFNEPQIVKFWSFGTLTATSQPEYLRDSARTNMNGMLSLVLDDYVLTSDWPSTITPQHPQMFKDIDWEHAQIRVVINGNSNKAAVNIDDTTEILPVPYALEVLERDSALTTQKIVDYLTIASKYDADQIIDALQTNNKLGKIRDTVVYFIKNNPQTARNLVLYYLHELSAENIQTAYDTIPAAFLDELTVRLANYAKRHKDKAYDVAISYIQNTSVDDVKAAVNAAFNSQHASEIANFIVDTVKDYLMTHDSVVAGIGKILVDELVPDDVNHGQVWDKVMHDWMKQETYDALKDILDSCIYNYLDTAFYAVSDSNCNKVDICQLQKQIEQLRYNRHTVCPELDRVQLSGATTTPDTLKFTAELGSSETITISDTFKTNKHDVALAGEGIEYFFLLTYPGTNKTKPDTLRVDPDHFNQTNNSFAYTIDNTKFNDYFKGRIVNISSRVTGIRCKSLDVISPDSAVIISTPYACPKIVSFTQTTGSSFSEGLSDNKGSIVTATLDCHYPNAISEWGFKVYDNDGTTLLETLKPTVKEGALKFDTTISMKYCNKTVKVKPYVICNNNTVTTDQDTFATIKFRDVYLTITHDKDTYTPGNNVKLTAKSYLKISTTQYINALGTKEPSIEKIVSYACSDDDATYKEDLEKYGFENPVYNWEWSSSVDQTQPTPLTVHKTCSGTADTSCHDTVQYVAPYYAVAGDTVIYKVTCTIGFLGDQCVVTDSVKIIRGFVCNDKVRGISGNVYGTIHIVDTTSHATKKINQCWTKTNLRDTHYIDPTDNQKKLLQNGTQTGTPVSVAGYYIPTAGLSDSIQGLLYNGYAVTKQICPSGWHVATDQDWCAMEYYVDTLGTNVNKDSSYCVNSDSAMRGSHAPKLAATDAQWPNWSNKTNVIGFSAYPVGLRAVDVTVPTNLEGWAAEFGTAALFWTSTENGTAGKYYYRMLRDRWADKQGVIRDSANQKNGFSVRCVQNGSLSAQ